MPSDAANRIDAITDSRAESFQRHRPLMFSIAYRMLGSVADAEDIVQEAFLRWHEAAATSVNNHKAYLATTVTRLCIDRKRAARAARELYVGPWLPEPLPDQRRPEFEDLIAMRQSVSTAFLLMLEKLSPVERAVFVLRDVFDYDYDEIAAMVRKTEVACRQIARRARVRLDAQERRFPAGPSTVASNVAAFGAACGNGDLNKLLSVLAEDVVLMADSGGAAPAFGRIRAIKRPLRGRAMVANFILRVLGQAPQGFGAVGCKLNGQPALVGFLEGRPVAALTFDVTARGIGAIYMVVNPRKLAHLQAPDTAAPL